MDIRYQVIIFFIAINLAMPAIVAAHQPRLTDAREHTAIEDPEVSKAYYGSLKGRPDVFVVEAKAGWDLYIEILVPDLPDARPDKSVRVEIEQDDVRHEIVELRGEKYQWRPFFEKFGGDYYLKGPEYRATAAPGRYIITIFSPDNTGKYTLAVGEKESFPPSEILRVLKTLPRVKRKFFNRSPLTAFFNLTGLLLLIPLLLVIGTVVLVTYFLKKKRKI